MLYHVRISPPVVSFHRSIRIRCNLHISKGFDVLVQHLVDTESKIVLFQAHILQSTKSIEVVPPLILLFSFIEHCCQP